MADGDGGAGVGACSADAAVLALLDLAGQWQGCCRSGQRARASMSHRHLLLGKHAPPTSWPCVVRPRGGPWHGPRRPGSITMGCCRSLRATFTPVGGLAECGTGPQGQGAGSPGAPAQIPRCHITYTWQPEVLPPCSDLRAPRRLHVTSRQVSGRSQHGALINITRARSTSTPRPPPGAVSVTVELS